MDEEQKQRMDLFEKRIANLEELVDLLMSLKKKKLDISNFTCEKIDFNEKRQKLFSNDKI